MLLSEVSAKSFVRYPTGLYPVDDVLGGGLVDASVVLLAAPPGIGKTTLTFQVLEGLGRNALFVTGEETVEQVAETARRIGATSSYGYAAYDLDTIFAKAQALRAQVLAIDSIQKMKCADVTGRAGSVTQVKECTIRLVSFAKTTKTAVWLIGQVTSDGDIAGPRALEHDVDVVLEMEQGTGREGRERLLRNVNKNRFGATGKVGKLELTDRGFVCMDEDGWDEKL
jgi:DNA repair protein RadA/Sms